MIKATLVAATLVLLAAPFLTPAQSASGSKRPGAPAFSDLSAAVWAGDVSHVQALLRAGADPNRRDSRGLAPLHYAAAAGNRAAAEILLASGADPSAVSAAGATPADIASDRGFGNLAAFLRTQARPAPPPASAKPRVYTDADIPAVRNRSRLANEGQFERPAAAKPQRAPDKPTPPPGNPGKAPVAKETAGAFRRAFEEGAWIEDIDGAVRLAGEVRRPMLALFTGSDWCYFCKKLEAEVLSKSAFREAVKGRYVLLYLDFPRGKTVPREVRDQKMRFAQKYGVGGYPTLVVLRNGTQYLDRISGFPRSTSAEAYVARIEAIAR